MPHIQFCPLSVVENSIIEDMIILLSVAHSASFRIVRRIRNCIHDGKIQFSKVTRIVPTYATMVSIPCRWSNSLHALNPLWCYARGAFRTLAGLTRLDRTRATGQTKIDTLVLQAGAWGMG